MTPAPLLRVDGLVAGYAEPVIGPVSFTMAPGEVVGLQGANGSGKSTLLRAIAGQARCFGGHLERAAGLTLGWQLQQPVRLAEMPLSGHDYLRFAQAGGTAPPPRLAAWLPRRVDTLSGGQFQLLAVWAMLGGTADLVLLDEPTNNLDPAGEQLLTELLHALPRRRSVLLVSHERPFLEAACHRVVEIGA